MNKPDLKRKETVQISEGQTEERYISNYLKTIPEASNVGTYYVWYYVAGDETHSDSEVPDIPITVTIAKYGNEIYITDAKIRNGKTSFEIKTNMDPHDLSDAKSAVAYYLNGKFVHIDIQAINVVSGYSEDIYSGDFDSSRAFLLDSSNRPLTACEEFKYSKPLPDETE